MKSWIRLLSAAGNIDSLIAAIAGFLIIYFFTLHGGVGISPDSVTYLSVARNLHAGNGFIAFDQMPLVQFPVLYPIFLESIFFITRHDPLTYASVINGLLFALLIYISGLLMNGFSFRSGWYKAILLSCFVLSPCLIEVYSMLWSETLFLILSLLFIACFQYDHRRQTLGSLLLVSLIAALACITRYAGISLIGTGALLLFLDFRLKWPKRILRTCIFFLGSYSLVTINLIRNRMVSGTLTGIRQKGTTPLINNLNYYGNTVSDWLSTSKDNHILALLTALVCLGVFGFLFLFRIKRRAHSLSYEDIGVVFGFLYSLFIILSATITRYQQLDSRLLSPLFIPLIWSLSYWIPPLIKTFSLRSRPWLIAGVFILFAGFQYHQLMADYETYDGVKDAGVPGYTEDPWPQSPTVNFIKSNQAIFLPGYSLYSNAGDAVYFFTGMYCDLVPEKVFPVEVKQFYEEDQHYLIWFNDIDNPDMIDLKDILQHKKMVCIRQFEDGAVYQFTR